jgi:hypothetical protein
MGLRVDYAPGRFPRNPKGTGRSRHSVVERRLRKMITPDEILHRPECLDEVDPRAAFALATKFQSAASICFQRAFLGLSSSAASATTERAPKPDNRLISIKDAALRINKHRSWLDRHGRRLGIVICYPTNGRALGASERAVERFLAGAEVRREG